MRWMTLAILSPFWASAALADISCTLEPIPEDAPKTLLIREVTGQNEAIILVAERTLSFDCPSQSNREELECYGSSEPPINAPTQLNVSAPMPQDGAIVIVTTRNQFFGKNEHIGYHRRHASVLIFKARDCEDY